MKRAALLLALGAAACTSGGRSGPDGPPLRPRADPSAVIAAEIGFSQLAQAKGQWTAFRETAADGAEMFVPERVKASDWLKGRADPSVAVKWQPHEVWSSCDGSYAVTRGAWQRPGSAGSFVTVWQRQKDGKYKWLLDMSLADERAPAAPDMVSGKAADCGKDPVQQAALAVDRAARQAATAAFAASGMKDTALGGSDDATLSWQSRTVPGSERHVSVQFWNGKGFDTVIDTRVTPRVP